MKFLSICIFTIGCYLIISDFRDIKNKVDSILKLNVRRYVRTNNLRSNGLCCDGSRVLPCRFCSFYLNLLKFNTTRVVDECNILSAFSSTFSSGITYNLAYKASEFTGFVLASYDFSTQRVLFDSYLFMNSAAYFNAVMYGQMGIFGNDMIHGSIYIIPLESSTKYRTLIFTLNNLLFSKNYANMSTECRSVNTSRTERNCTIGISARIGNRGILRSTGLRLPSGGFSFNLRWMQATIREEAFTASTDITITIFDTSNQNVTIDTVTFNNTGVMPKEYHIFNDIPGSLDIVRVSLSLKYDCKGYEGQNCKYMCESDENIFCNPNTGLRHCRNGGNIDENCTYNSNCSSSSCLNGGECSLKVNGIFCKCLYGYFGLFCELTECKKYCYKGYCDEFDQCICDSGSSGVSCEYSTCNSTLASRCLYGGVCSLYLTNPICFCPYFAEGDNCSIIICPSDCLSGNCSVKMASNGTYFRECEDIVTIPRTENTEITISPSTIFTDTTTSGSDIPLTQSIEDRVITANRNNTIYIVLISIFSSLILLMSKLAIYIIISSRVPNKLTVNDDLRLTGSVSGL